MDRFQFRHGAALQELDADPDDNPDQICVAAIANARLRQVLLTFETLGKAIRQELQDVA